MLARHPVEPMRPRGGVSRRATRRAMRSRNVTPEEDTPMERLDLDPGNGVLFKNDKGDNPNRPDYRGELQTPEGEHLKVAVWVKRSKKGKPYMSLSIQAMDDEDGQDGAQVPADTADFAQAPAQASMGGTADDDIPF